MSVNSVYVAATGPESGTVNTCESSEQATCEQQCLVQPRFFCGQLLTDQDLTLFLDWSQAKFRLDRNITGWGVSCGLQVRCDPAPDRPGGVLIEAGHAVDSCGNDIVVCEQQQLALSNACPVVEPICAGFQGEQTEEPQTSQFLGFPLPPGDISLVDIYIHYKTVETDSLPALGRGACRERSACEFSRTRESHYFEARLVDPNNDTPSMVLQQWENNYINVTRQVVDDYLARFGPNNPSNHLEVQNWFSTWIDSHSLYEFCFVRDAICSIPDSTAENQLEFITNILSLLVLDNRIGYLAKGCVTGVQDQSVPLARVYLQRRNNNQSSVCHVLHVDSFPPYRRQLKSDLWPAPLGKVNLGQFIWHRAEEVCLKLHDLGFQVLEHEYFLPHSPNELLGILDMERLSTSGDIRCGLYADLPCPNSTDMPILHVYTYYGAPETLGPRVITFCCEELDLDMFVSGKSGQNVDNTQEEPGRPPVQKEQKGFDDLTNIHGIGRERALKLRQEGVSTYAQLAALEIERLERLFPRLKREQLQQWCEQARKFTG